MSARGQNSDDVLDPPRLLGKSGAAAEGQTPGERKAAELLRSVGEPTPPTPHALASVERAVLARASDRESRAGGWLRGMTVPRLAWALMIVLVVSSGAVPAWLSTRHVPPVRPDRDRRVEPPRAAPAIPAPPEEPAPPRAPAAAAVPVVRDRPHRWIRAIRAPSRPIALASAADASRAAAFGAEGALLGRALRALREERNPSAALTTLDEYERTYPRGRLHHEAAVARLEALVLAGRRDQALSALEGGLPALEPLGRSELVLRGELRAAVGRQAAARDDFAAASALGGNDDLAARSLLDLARMQQALGDQSAAEQSLRRYLAAFPHGAGAEEARRALTDAP